MEPLAQALADTVERAVRLQTAARGDGRAGGDDLQQQDVPDGVPLSEDFGEDFGAYPASGIGPVWSDDNDRRPDVTQARSEEHTSELQSLMRISYAVFCLKKKNRK